MCECVSEYKYVNYTFRQKRLRICIVHIVVCVCVSYNGQHFWMCASERKREGRSVVLSFQYQLVFGLET